MWNGTEAKHDQGQVVKLVWASQPQMLRGLQGTMEPLHKAVGLRMETGCSGMCNVQEGVQNASGQREILSRMVKR